MGVRLRVLKDPDRILVGMDALIEQKRAELRGDPEREERAWLERSPRWTRSGATTRGLRSKGA